jgi:NusA-like KH domain protein
MAGNTIDMRIMRYINLFGRISNVATKYCFVYNNVIVFVVPGRKVSKAIGKGGSKIKRLGRTLGKRIKVIAAPDIKEEGDMKKFVESLVSPVSFKKIEFKGNAIEISAGKQDKAALIGRNRIREKELERILKNFFKISRLNIR